MAEYRQGFSTCRDCGIPLVGTEDKARHTGVDKLWNGNERAQFDRVIAALDDAGMPFQPKEMESTVRAFNRRSESYMAISKEPTKA